MERKSEFELIRMLEDARRHVEVGTRYAHYKNPEHTYMVSGLSIFVGTNEVAVVYKAEYGERVLFTRLLTEWLETVEWQGQDVPRFRNLANE